MTRILTPDEAKLYIGRQAENGVDITDDMLREVLKYTTQIQHLVESTGGTLMVEQKLSIAEWTGEYRADGSPAKGTSDAVILAGDELIIADLKFGRGVEVSAEDNPQLMIYALAALGEFDPAGVLFARVRLVISQPRLGHYSEWSLSVEDLLAFGERVKLAAQACDQPDAPLVPSEKGCKFCRAKAVCPALRAEVAETVSGIAGLEDFDDVTQPVAVGTLSDDTLSVCMRKIDLIEGWCKAIRAETESRLLAGKPVPGYKLVQGKQGNRKWASDSDAEAALKGFRLKTDEMYDLTLISPTKAEKLVGEKVLGPRQWKKLLPLITRSEGKLSVAPASDKRPEVQVAADTSDFDPVVNSTKELSPLDFV